MPELLQESFLSVNLISTTLLILVIIYWLMVILGALDVELFDFDLDADADADIDMDADIDSPGFLRAVLEFFYIGEVPIMVLASIFILTSWVISVMGNYYLNPERGVLVGSGIAVGNLFVSIILTKIFSMPARKVFKMFDNDPNAPKKVIGRIGVVLTSQVSDKMGQVEIKTKGAPIVLNAKTEDGTVLKKGEEAIVVRQNEEKTLYYVMPVEVEKV